MKICKDYEKNVVECIGEKCFTHELCGHLHPDKERKARERLAADYAKFRKEKNKQEQGKP